jgi:hypothetical protein
MKSAAASGTGPARVTSPAPTTDVALVHVPVSSSAAPTPMIFAAVPAQAKRPASPPQLSLTEVPAQAKRPGSTPQLSLAEVRALVLKACGKQASNIAVKYLPDGKLEVRLDVANETLAPQIYDRIVNIRELGTIAPWVKIQVTH